MAKKRRRLNPREAGGVALLMVLLMVTLLGALVADFQFAATVDLRLAYNARDELQAEYNALSALKMRALLLRNSRALEQGLNSALGSLGGAAGGQQLPIGQMLDMIPVECGILSSVIKRADSGFGDDEAVEEDPFFPGECLATSTSEHSKIGINALRRLSGQDKQRIQQLLFGILSDPKMERHFQEDDRNGVHAENPQELVAAITDWIDDNETQEGNSVADEERPYDLLEDSYRPKNAPMDSVAELQMIHGIDDELYDLLKDRVTVHANTSQIELATADDITIWFGMTAAMHDGQVDIRQCAAAFEPFFLQMQEIRTFGTAGFGTMNVSVLRTIVESSGLSACVDVGKLSQVFTDQAGNAWYTIEAQGRVGNASRRIRAVIQAQEGRLYYIRIE